MHWRALWNRTLWEATALAGWHLLRPPALALVTVLAARLAGGRGLPLLATAAAGLGLAAGWFALFGLPPTAHALIVDHTVADQARLLALAALAAALLAGSAGASETLVSVLLAAGIGWWMADAPATRADFARDGAAALASGAVAWLFLHLLRPTGSTGRALAAGAALAGALALAAAARPWLMLALVPATCAAGLLRGPDTEAARLPVAAGLAIACIAIVHAAGRLPSGALGPIDTACVAPLVTLWACARLRRMPPLLGNTLGAAAGLGFAVLAARLIAWF